MKRLALVSKESEYESKVQKRMQEILAAEEAKRIDEEANRRIFDMKEAEFKKVQSTISIDKGTNSYQNFKQECKRLQALARAAGVPSDSVRGGWFMALPAGQLPPQLKEILEFVENSLLATIVVPEDHSLTCPDSAWNVLLKSWNMLGNYPIAEWSGDVFGPWGKWIEMKDVVLNAAKEFYSRLGVCVVPGGTDGLNVIWQTYYCLPSGHCWNIRQISYGWERNYLGDSVEKKHNGLCSIGVYSHVAVEVGRDKVMGKLAAWVPLDTR